ADVPRHPDRAGVHVLLRHLLPDTVAVLRSLARPEDASRLPLRIGGRTRDAQRRHALLGCGEHGWRAVRRQRAPGRDRRRSRLVGRERGARHVPPGTRHPGGVSRVGGRGRARVAGSRGRRGRSRVGAGRGGRPLVLRAVARLWSVRRGRRGERPALPCLVCASTRPGRVAATLSGTFRKVPAGRTRNHPRRPASDPKKRGRFPLGTGAVRRSPPPRSPRSARRASMPRTFPGSRGPRATPSREAPFDAKSTSSTSTATPVTLTAWAFGAAAVTGEEA